MRLSKLHIEREEWGSNKGQLRGKVKFQGEIGEIDIILSNEHIDQIFHVCADALTTTAQEAGSLMTSALLDQSAETKAIEGSKNIE